MTLHLLRHSRKGFTLVELLVGMVVFVTGIAAVYVLLQQTIRSAVVSRNEVVVANLLREQIELARHIRDTNLSQHTPWDRVPSEGQGIASWEEAIYTIENDFTATGVTYNASGAIQSSSVKLQKLPLNTEDSLESRFNASRLFLDAQGRYTHTETTTGTLFASYLHITPMAFTGVDG